MKKISLLLVVVMLFALAFAGCSGSSSSSAGKTEDSNVSSSGAASSASDSTSAGAKSLKVVLLIPGTLGDKSFFDSANNGLKMVKDQLGATTKVIEMGTDKTKYQPTLDDVCNQDWDIIVSGGPDMSDLLNAAGKANPQKKFINYDASVLNAESNVYAMQYSAKDLSFAAGAAAALISTSGMPLANKDKTIGFLGGMDIPGINDFLVGYIEGAQYAVPDIKVAISYAQDFANPGKGKELSLVQYNSGVDIIFNVAGGTGLGIMDAAKEKNKYAIGVDSDQALLFKDTDPEKAKHILTSAIKKIDAALLGAVKNYTEGKLAFGKVELLGFKENGVGLANNEFYNQVPQDIRDKVDQIEQKLVSGEIKVDTAIGMPNDKLNSIRNAVKPQ